MLRLVYTILNDFGIPLLGILIIFGLIIIGSLLWKIISNHLHHIGNDVKEVLGKVIKLEEGFVKMGERVSFLEGKTATKRVRKTKSR
ncbi:MAG TPA: hypothetical protein VMX17_10150 [Candidatus Glassbacteria bacterium]|nr:hypothetical protein [Candidatus Glassbacteria bacterium]